MSPYPRQVYLLDPKKLSPETIAVTFAKTSRSPESFKEIAEELTETKSADFHEKWVVGYGHSSVAEHAVLHLALENISRLAVETIQSSRLASFTEKSTRYQKWSADAFFTPPELFESGLLDSYQASCRMLFETYQQANEACREVVKCDCPQQDGEKDSAYERRIKPIIVDACRYLLPASSLANLGMTANARVIEHLVTKMLSHPLSEVRMVGNEIKAVAQAEVPTLVKYANRDEYIEKLPAALLQPHSQYYDTREDWCSLVDYDLNGEDKFITALLYRFGLNPYSNCLDEVADMSPEEKSDIIRKGLGGMDRFDWPLRETEHVHYTFDVLMDQGAYYEVKRHRMMTQTPQDLTCLLGYATPRLIERANFTSEYSMAMDSAAITYQQLAAWNPAAAGYIVPNGFNRRVMLTLNFREAFNFIQLRSADGAHFSVRRVAQRMAQEIRRVHPLLGEYLRVNPTETWEKVDTDFFTAG
jgi:thymidylate synthase ThyX